VGEHSESNVFVTLALLPEIEKWVRTVYEPVELYIQENTHTVEAIQRLHYWCRLQACGNKVGVATLPPIEYQTRLLAVLEEGLVGDLFFSTASYDLMTEPFSGRVVKSTIPTEVEQSSLVERLFSYRTYHERYLLLREIEEYSIVALKAILLRNAEGIHPRRITRLLHMLGILTDSRTSREFGLRYLWQSPGF